MANEKLEREGIEKKENRIEYFECHIVNKWKIKVGH